MSGKKTRSPGQIVENSLSNIILDLDPQVSPVVYKAIKKRALLKIFSLRWAFQGPLGPLVIVIIIIIIIISSSSSSSSSSKWIE